LGKGHARTCPRTICFELGEPVEMPFGLGCVGSGSNKGWGAHWHHLVNEKSMCDGDVAFFWSNYVDSGVLCQQRCSCIPKFTKIVGGWS